MSYKLAGVIWNDDGTMATKKLSPLEAWNRIKKEWSIEDLLKEEFGKETKIIEAALKDKEQQDNVLKVLKEVVQFNSTLPEIEISDDGSIGKLCERITMRQLRDIENKERELLRQWVLKTCFPKELKALEIISNKICVDFFIGLDNEYVYVLKLKNSKDFMPITKEQYDILKEVLL